jgi:hypothetical protein
MKRTSVTLTRLLLIAGLTALCGQLCCAIAADADKPSQPALSGEQQQAGLKEKWRKELGEAQNSFLLTNDRESVDFVGRILESLDKPEGMSPSALAVQAKRMETRTRELVRAGALESAAALNYAMWSVRFDPNDRGADGPARTGNQAGGAPGPGGLVLYLPCDSPPTNGIVLDASGAGNHGRVEGAQWVPEGRFGGAYRFRITNLTDRIVVPNSDSLNSEYVTVAAWIKSPDSDGFWNRIVDKDWRKGYSLSLGGDYNGKWSRGKLCLEVQGDAIGSDQTLGDDRWHHVAATFDGKFFRMYVDGKEKSQPAGNSKPISNNNWDLCIGNSLVDYGTGEFVAFDGLIDEVRVYNRALSADEIKALATATQAGAGAAATSAPEPAAQPTAAERLKQVKELHDKGLINKQDYDKKVKEILDSL